MNTQMTDKDLDMLFAESAKRQPDVAHINATVMRTVRRDLRLKKLRKWAKLLGVCFGLPIAVVVYIYALFVFMPEMPEQLWFLSIALPIATILFLAAQKIRYFSPEV